LIGFDASGWVRGLPPERSDGLTFHLPLEVMALEHVGANRVVVEQRIHQNLADVLSQGLKDPPLYRWAERAYSPTARELLAEDSETRRRAFAKVAPLGEGLAGAAFHGLIRLGYGCLRRDEQEIARGLAYLRSRRHVLASPHGAYMASEEVQPTKADFKGVSIFDQLTIASGSYGNLRPEDIDGPLPRITALCTEALELVQQRPSSFIAVHTVDALHALVEFESLVVGGPPADDHRGSLLLSWWRAYLWALRTCAALVADEPANPSHFAKTQFSAFPELIAAAIDSGETHDLKLVVALQRLTELGVITPNAALEVGSAKLRATQGSIS
jgi:hypothetical protein